MNDEGRAAVGVWHFPALDESKTQELCSRIVFAKVLYKLARGDPAPPMDDTPVPRAGRRLADAGRTLQRHHQLDSLPEDTKAAILEDIESERARANNARGFKKDEGPPHYVFVASLTLAYFEASGKLATAPTDRDTGRIVSNKFTDFAQDAFAALCPEHAPLSLDAIKRALDKNPPQGRITKK